MDSALSYIRVEKIYSDGNLDKKVTRSTYLALFSRLDEPRKAMHSRTYLPSSIKGSDWVRGGEWSKRKINLDFNLDFSGKIGYCDVVQQLFFVNIISAQIHVTSFQLGGKKIIGSLYVRKKHAHKNFLKECKSRFITFPQYSFLFIFLRMPRIITGYRDCHMTYQLKIYSVNLMLADQCKSSIKKLASWLVSQLQIHWGNF